MKNRMWNVRIAHTLMVVAMLASPLTRAAEICVGTTAIQVVSTTPGVLELYVYSTELPNGGSTYLYYTGNNETVRVFQAQFLYAKALGVKACVGYTPGTPWILFSVAVPSSPTGAPYW